MEKKRTGMDACKWLVIVVSETDNTAIASEVMSTDCFSYMKTYAQICAFKSKCAGGIRAFVKRKNPASFHREPD